MTVGVADSQDRPMTQTRSPDTEQMAAWSGRFGAEYTSRNNLSAAGIDTLYKTTVGSTRSEINDRFLVDVAKDARIVEVGTNVGLQLMLLGEAGWVNLWGIELQWGAIDVARRNVPRANIVQANAFDIPFKDGWFDLAFTSGVLIHIGPGERARAMQEIHRLSRRWIWGYEYWSADLKEVSYRGKKNLLWKADYARMYLDLFPDLTLVKEERLKRLVDDNVDTVFLLEKR